jgi:hypothetical protein
MQFLFTCVLTQKSRANHKVCTSARDGKISYFCIFVCMGQREHACVYRHIYIYIYIYCVCVILREGTQRAGIPTVRTQIISCLCVSGDCPTQKYVCQLFLGKSTFLVVPDEGIQRRFLSDGHTHTHTHTHTQTQLPATRSHFPD